MGWAVGSSRKWPRQRSGEEMSRQLDPIRFTTWFGDSGCEVHKAVAIPTTNREPSEMLAAHRTRILWSKIDLAVI